MAWLSLEELRKQSLPKRREKWMDLLERGVLNSKETLPEILDSFSDDRMPEELDMISPELRGKIKTLLVAARPYKPLRLFLIGPGPSNEEAEAWRLMLKRRYKQLTSLLGIQVSWCEERQEFV